MDEKIKALSEQDNASEKRARSCQTLANLQLQKIAEQIARQKNTVSQNESELLEIKSQHKNIHTTLDSAKEELHKNENDPAIVPPTPFQKEKLDERYAKSKERLRLDNLDRVTTHVVQALGKKTEEINRIIPDCEKAIESIFSDFKRSWPMDAIDVDTTLSSASDFLQN